jgi:hypothetical protein
MRPINSLLGLFAFVRWLVAWLLLVPIAWLAALGAILLGLSRVCDWVARGLMDIGNRIAP